MTDRYFTTTDERVIYSNRFSFIKQDNISLKSMGSYDPTDIKEYDQFVYQGNRIKSFIDDFACDGDFIKWSVKLCPSGQRYKRHDMKCR